MNEVETESLICFSYLNLIN